MQKILASILVLGLSLTLSACGRKQQSLEQMQEPMSMEALSALNTAVQSTPESKPQEAPLAVVTPAKSEPAVSGGFTKPTVEQIQAALKNANYYTGAVDGKKGPLTNKAIEEFQRASGLEADGKVGPKTWAILSPYLNPPLETKPKKGQ